MMETPIKFRLNSSNNLKPNNPNGASSSSAPMTKVDLDRRRKIEIKCLELEGMLESQG